MKQDHAFTPAAPADDAGSYLQYMDGSRQYPPFTMVTGHTVMKTRDGRYMAKKGAQVFRGDTVLEVHGKALWAPEPVTLDPLPEDRFAAGYRKPCYCMSDYRKNWAGMAAAGAVSTWIEPTPDQDCEHCKGSGWTL